MGFKAILLIIILGSSFVIASEAPVIAAPQKADVIASKAKSSSVHSPTAAQKRDVGHVSAKTIEFNDKNFSHAKPSLNSHREERSDAAIQSPRNDKVKINTKERSLKNWEMQRQLEALINKSKNDLRMDELIQKHLGISFKRASAYDLYPLELYDAKLSKLDEANRTEFIEYYDYARRELLSVSQGPQLKYLYQDYDQDGNGDYAVIVARVIQFDKKGLAHKPSHKDRIYLLIANTDQVNYFQPLNADYLELINGGRHPTNLAIGRRLVKVNGPAFRALALDGESYVLHYDLDKAAWLKRYTNEDSDGG